VSLQSKYVSVCNWMVNEATQRMTIESTYKDNNYSKQCVNYFQSWHMGTTNKLLQTALRKWMHRSRQPEAVVVICHHTVGENALGLNRPCHHYRSIQEVLCQQLFRWHGRCCIVCWTLCQIRHWIRQRRWTDTTDVQWREW